MHRTRLIVVASLALAGSALVALDQAALAQGQSASELLDRFREQSARAETAGLAESFKGITAAGAVEPGLFALRSTGVSTEPVRVAAAAFLASLTPAERQATAFGI